MTDRIPRTMTGFGEVDSCGKRHGSRCLRVDHIRRELGRSMFARNIVWRERMDSTHLHARSLAAAGAVEGTLVLTEEQTAGRGRMSRRWMSPPRANLLFSMLLKPRLRADRAFVLTMILALASADAIGSVCGVETGVKWPNDLYRHDKKLGGILTEFWTAEKDVEAVVLGLGLNVHWCPADGSGLDYKATSLILEAGKPVAREDLLVGILLAYERYYRQVLDGDPARLVGEWNRRSVLLGRAVEVRRGETPLTGEAVRIEADGALIVRDGFGAEHRVLYGDVSVRALPQACGNPSERR